MWSLRAGYEWGRGVKQASNSYMKNHVRFFDYPLNTLSYPIAQTPTAGFVRSPVDRQKLYDWMTKLSYEAIKYDQVPYAHTTTQEQIADELRKIAFAPSSA